MDEFELIERFFHRSELRDDVLLGIGDDGAVTALPPGRQLLGVLDTLVEGVHYPRDMAPDDIGYRAVAVNLSDLAAMGAKPAWMLLGLTLREPDPDWLRAFAAGLFTAADEHDVTLIGGDTTRGAETVVTVQMSGHAAPGAWLTRGGSQAGDAIYLSGTSGDAAAGLHLMQEAAGDTAAGDTASGDAAEYLLQRFRRPAARVRLGQELVAIASAAIDVSDGLYADLARLLAASGTAGVIEFSSLPLSPQLRQYCGEKKALSLALGGGDDYELCFTVPPAGEASLQVCAERLGCPVTRIGTVEAGHGLRCTLDGNPVDYDDTGYRHF